MRNIPFKRQLIILVPCILLIGIMIPLTTFAKSSAQNATSTAQQAAPPASIIAKTLIVIHNDANCLSNPAPANAGSGSQVLFTATKRVKVDVIAQLYSSDFPEEEGLLLSDSNGRFAPKTIDRSLSTAAGATTIHFSFIATKGDALSACFKLLIPDNEGNIEFSVPFPNDHPAAVYLTITSDD